MNHDDTPGLVTPESLEGFRAYLLAVAGRRMGPDLAAKVGASDLVQETLLAARHDGGAFRGRSPEELKGWLKAILRHLIANTRRHYFDTKKRRAGAEVSLTHPGRDGSTWATLADTGTTASGLAMRDELRDSVTQGLDSLPDHYRQVLLCRYRDELTFEAIGERLGTSAEAARKLWGRAVVRLRAALESGHDPG